MERSVIRERHCHIDGLIPDYAALHPGYRRYASVALMTAGQIIQFLNLKPHPEGGHFAETFRDATGVGGRAASTAIYFLLARGERSRWHRVDAAEVWHYYAGAPLKLEIAETDEGPIRCLRLGADFSAGERPQAVVPR